MQITLAPDLVSFVRGKVDAGAFPSADAFVAERLRRWQKDERISGYSREELKVMVREGFAQIDRGECEHFDSAGMKQFFQQLRDEAAATIGATS